MLGSHYSTVITTMSTDDSQRPPWSHAVREGLRDGSARVVAYPEPPDSPDARLLLAALDAYLSSLYRPEEQHTHLPPGDVAPGRGTFLVARIEVRDGTGDPGGRAPAVGCGAVRLRDPATAEVKRMWVEPEARRHGVARTLIAALEAHARDLGATRGVLETGVHQVEALPFYRAAGWRQIPCFDEYALTPTSVCFAKDLGR